MDNTLRSAPPASVVPADAPAERDYYSVSQAAALLGVSRVSIWRWISAGRLPASRLGHRTTRIRRQDLERLLNEGDGAGSRSRIFPGRGTGTGDETATEDRAAHAPHADWRSGDASGHFVQFYEADAFLLDAVKDFIGATLRADDIGIVIATPPHRAGLEDRLRAEGLDVDAARADGQYVALDATEMLSRIVVDGAPAPGRFAEVVGGLIARAADGQRRVRVFGEMVAILAMEGNHEAVVRLEELWNDLQTTHTFALFCAYPLECLDGEAGAALLDDVCAAHARVIPAESYAALPTTDDRLRAITALQQQAQSLEAALAGEGAARREAEAARQRAEHLAAALETERDRLRPAVEATALGTWDFDPQTGALRWSDRCKELFGLPPTAAVDYDVFLAGLHPEDRAGTHASVQRALDPASGGAFSVTYRTIGLEDGIERWVAATGRTFFDAQGQAVRFIGTVLDVSGHKRAEALQEVETRALELVARRTPLPRVLDELAHAVEALADGMLASVLLLDEDGRHLRHGAAPSLPDAYNRAIDGIEIGPAAGSCGTAAHRGERVVVADIAVDPLWADFRNLALAHGLRACWSAPIRGAGGRVLGTFALYYRAPRTPSLGDLDLIDRVARVAGLAIERSRAEAERERLLTREREARAEAETLLRVGQVLAAELDLQKVVQAVTDAATTLSGAQFGAFFYNVVDERGEAYQLYTISGARREDFERFPLPRNTAIFGPTFRGEGVMRLADVTQDPRYGRNAPYHGLPPGHLPVRSYLAVPVTVRSGEVIGGLFLAHPRPGVFTERGERLVVGLAAQAAIAMDNARLYQEARHAIHARDEFLSTAAHDLKTPLTGIKGQAQLLRRRIARANMPEARQLTEGLSNIDQTATRLNDLINGLLDLTRLRLDRPLDLDLRPTNLVALARQAVAALQPSTTRHWLRVEADPDELVGSWDSSRLARVLDNLLSNAIKYSPDGGPIIVCIRQENGHLREQGREDEYEQAREQEQDAAETWAVLEVRDSGLGIPSEELPRVFEHFQRASNVVGRIDGTGIGLASARHIVESHGGTLTVESQEGQGSTFTVYLPLTSDPAPDSDPLPAEEKP